MNCAAVRDRLTERALGAVPADDGQALDRHLAWCAACRKEAGELDRAATTFAFALAPASPHPIWKTGSWARCRRWRRSSDLPALGAAGWPSRLRWPACSRCRDWVGAPSWRVVPPGSRIFEGRATEATGCERRLPPDPQQLGVQRSRERGVPGNALERHAWWSGRRIRADAGVAEHGGYRDRHGERVRRSVAKDALPFRVFLTDEHGKKLAVGMIKALDTGGGAILSAPFELDLSRYTGVDVVDKNGNVVLHGSVSRRPSITTPSP